MRARSVLAGVALFAVALGQSGPALAGDEAPPAKNCVAAEEASVRAAGDSESEAPPKFSPAFYRRRLTLDASLDGADGPELPISIEQVCGVPKALKKQAVQLAGTDAVGLISSTTKVFMGKDPVSGPDAISAIDGADTALLRVRLARPSRWREDEDSNKVPTFVLYRVEITD